jgi:ComF family protein
LCGSWHISLMGIYRISQSLRGIGQWALAQLFPAHCPSCGTQVSAQGNLCPTCFSEAHHITAPFCVGCGTPFAVDMGPEAQCVQCLNEPPDFDTARAVMVYNDVSGKLIGRLKYQDRMAGLDYYARAMATLGHWHGVDVIVPVPMHWRRLAWRRYNQAAWLAFALADMTAIPCEPGYLIRPQPTKRQTGMKRAERIQNLKHAFHVPVKHLSAMQGRHVMLVDDVITTGATANACAKALKAAGASRVSVVALARTTID